MFHIGAPAHLDPCVRVGNDCEIGPGAVIGSIGFGYNHEPDGRWTRKPHQYGVQIGDDVHVGANTCIDRGSWRDTRIGRGSRIDNLVHIAHNVVIGEDCVVVAQAMLAGSVTVEDGAWIGPGARIMQRVTIGAGSLVGMGAVVLKDVPPNRTVVGNPARILFGKSGVRESM